MVNQRKGMLRNLGVGKREKKRESVQYLQETIYEVQPTFMHGVPRIWEKIAAQAYVAIEGSSWIKKFAYRLAMKIGGQRYFEAKWEGKNPSWPRQLLRWLAIQIAFRHLLTRLGLSKVIYFENRNRTSAIPA